MADPMTDEEKLAQLQDALGIISIKDGETQTVFQADTSKVRAELQRRVDKAAGTHRTRVRYVMQTSKGY